MSTASTSVPVPWARLRAWVDEHEAMDLGALSSQGGLSVAQLEAISLLVPFLNPPGASDADYVSLLNRRSLHTPLYESPILTLLFLVSAQKKQLATPFYQDAEPVNVPIAGKMQPGWSYTCTVSAIEGRFPRQGYGIDQGGVAPVFETKKVKQPTFKREALMCVEASEAVCGKTRLGVHSAAPDASPSPSPRQAEEAVGISRHPGVRDGRGRILRNAGRPSSGEHHHS